MKHTTSLREITEFANEMFRSNSLIMDEKFKILNDRDIDFRKLGKCDTNGCDGKGNLRQKFKTHTSSKNCPNKLNKQLLINEIKKKKLQIKLEEENRTQDKIETYINSVTNHSQSLSNQELNRQNQELKTKYKKLLTELSDLQGKSKSFIDNAQNEVGQLILVKRININVIISSKLEV